MNCPSCAVELPQTAKFCGACGHQFASRPVGGAMTMSSAPDFDALVANPRAFPPMLDVFKEAWGAAKPNLGILIGGMLVLGVAMVAAMMTVIGLVAVPALAGGFAIVALKIVRGHQVGMNDFFLGLKLFLPLMLLGIVQGFLTNLGMYALVIPGLYLSIAWSMSQFVMIDRGIDFWPAMEASRKVVHTHFWNVFGFMMLAGLGNIIVAIPTCYLGLIVTGPVTGVAFALLYDKLFGIAGGAERLV